VPVAVAYGDHDIFGEGSELVRKRFPAARQITFSQSGHIPCLQAPEQFEEVLVSFYDRDAAAG
jgi:pimeloyl-ACP methyl ester carboxylesterase